MAPVEAPKLLLCAAVACAAAAFAAALARSEVEWSARFDCPAFPLRGILLLLVSVLEDAVAGEELAGLSLEVDGVLGEAE